MTHVSTASALAFATGYSEHVEPLMAVEQLVDETSGVASLGGADLAILFASGRHVGEMQSMARFVHESLAPGVVLGVSAAGVMGGETASMKRGAASLIVASLPGTRLHPFSYRDLPHVHDQDELALSEFADAMGLDHDTRGIIMLSDPCSVPPAALLGAINQTSTVVEGTREPPPVFGGMASASPAPGGNVMVLGSRIMRAGAVGVSISGDISIDPLVSQGCRPIGEPMVITAARNNVIMSLSGRRAIDVLHATISNLGGRDRDLLPNGVFLGRVVNEYKPRFGRGDFLVRTILGYDQNSGAVAVADNVRVGQTVQLHVRDERTAREDLELLLDIQRVRGAASGALMFSCAARAGGLLESPADDLRIVSRALRTAEGNRVPIAGCFAAGEFGAVGGNSFLHAHTASAAIFRQSAPAE